MDASERSVSNTPRLRATFGKDLELGAGEVTVCG
jgi:hypothetical protein